MHDKTARKQIEVLNVQVLALSSLVNAIAREVLEIIPEESQDRMVAEALEIETEFNAGLDKS